MHNVKDVLIKAQKFNETEDFEKTILLLDDNTLIKCKDIELYAEKVQAFWGLRRYEDCEILLNSELLQNNNNAKLNHYLGNIFGLKTNHEEAIKLYFKAIQIDSNFHKPYIALGMVFLYKEDYTTSKTNFEKALSMKPNDYFVYYGLGLYYTQLEDSEKAIECFNKSMSLKNDNYDTLIGLARLKQKQCEYEEARSYFKKAIQEKPNFALAYALLGNLCTIVFNYQDMQRKHSEAIEYYKKALELDKKLAIAYNGLGHTSKIANLNENAIGFYNDAIKLAPKELTYYCNLGITYFEVDRFEEAKLNFQACLNSKNKELIRVSQYYLEEMENMEGLYYKKMSKTIKKIKQILLYRGECITHYTGVSVAKQLILKESKFRLSEGTFLNDTSEGQELFTYLGLEKINSSHFIKKPFIGSFVAATKNNDLNLWRMYGKEAKEEAKGCSLTISMGQVIQTLYKVSSKTVITPKEEFFNFYRVAYYKNNEFSFESATNEDKEKLNILMLSLKDIIREFNESLNEIKEDKLKIYELLNEIAYIFKSFQFEFESEVRIILKNIDDYKINIDTESFIPRVYIELIPIFSMIKNITIGPKVERADEWASAFHYHFEEKGIKAEINISNLPYK